MPEIVLFPPKLHTLFERWHYGWKKNHSEYLYQNLLDLAPDDFRPYVYFQNLNTLICNVAARSCSVIQASVLLFLFCTYLQKEIFKKKRQARVWSVNEAGERKRTDWENKERHKVNKNLYDWQVASKQSCTKVGLLHIQFYPFLPFFLNMLVVVCLFFVCCFFALFCLVVVVVHLFYSWNLP